MNRRNGRTPRRGLTTVAVLVCLVVIMLISGVLLKTGIAHRDQVRAQERSLQAQWLAQAGLDRAQARLAQSAGYTGEIWELASRDLGLPEPTGAGHGPAAVVMIKIVKSDSSPERRLIKVQADFPPDPPRRARHSAQMLVELGSKQTGASR
jgi:hypothetical protein